MVTDRLKKALAKARSPRCILREATLNDVEAIHQVELSSWGCSGAATPDKIRSRIRKYPEGQRVAVLRDSGQVVGFVSTMKLSAYQVRNLTSWAQITGDGYITNHNPDGNHLYGVDLSVHQVTGNRGIGNLLLAEIAAMVIRRGIKYVLLGGRLPGLRQYNNQRAASGEEPIPAVDYAALTRSDKKPYDPELRLYMGIWFMENLGVLANYFPDADSENNGVLLRWYNPLYRWFFGVPYKIPILGKICVELIARLVARLL